VNQSLTARRVTPKPPPPGARLAPADEHYLADTLQPAGPKAPPAAAADDRPGGDQGADGPPEPPLLGLYCDVPPPPSAGPAGGEGGAAAAGAAAPAPALPLLRPSAPLYSVELDPAVLGAGGEVGRGGGGGWGYGGGQQWGQAGGGYGFRPDGFGAAGAHTGSGAGGAAAAAAVRVSGGGAGAAGGGAAPASASPAARGVRARARSAHTAAVESLGVRLIVLEERRAALAERLARGGEADEPGGRQELERLTATINRLGVWGVRGGGRQPSLSLVTCQRAQHLPRASAGPTGRRPRFSPLPRRLRQPAGTDVRDPCALTTHKLLALATRHAPTAAAAAGEGGRGSLGAGHGGLSHSLLQGGAAGARAQRQLGRGVDAGSCLRAHLGHTPTNQHAFGVPLTSGLPPTAWARPHADGAPGVSGAISAALAAGISGSGGGGGGVLCSGGPAAAAAAAAGATGPSWRPRGVLVRGGVRGAAGRVSVHPWCSAGQNHACARCKPLCPGLTVCSRPARLPRGLPLLPRSG
jgi:hypothetical protein